MPERKCVGCTQQEEWGCKARKVREPIDENEKLQPDKFWVFPAYLPVEIDGEEIFNCPRQSLNEMPKEWNRLLKFYGMYKQGFLPDEGPVVHQSNVLVEAFRLMDIVNSEADEQLEKERTKKKGRPDGFSG